MVKKFLLFLLITFMFSLQFTPSSAFAEARCGYFAGLVSWDCNIDLEGIEDQKGLESGIWTIAANILTDISVVAAYLVIGYVIYGGYQYIFSAGDPGKVATGKKTLSQAFIGLAIVMLSNVILNSIRIAFGVNFNSNCVDSECVDPGAMIISTINWVIGIAGVVSAIFVVYGGVAYITSAGDPAKLQKAKSTILYALIGLVIVALSEMIVSFVSNIIIKAETASLTPINKIISKG